MRETDPGIDPDGLDTVIHWVAALYREGSSRTLWTTLDDRLRLALSQGWVFGKFGAQDDDLAEDLADEDTDNPHFPLLLAQLADRWRSVYKALRGEMGVYQRSFLVGVDMELIVLTGPEHIGTVRANSSIPAHCFIIRFENDEWRIAALARRLPVPGWPPTERDVSALVVADETPSDQ